MEIITSKSGFRYIYERESGYLSLLPESSTESGKTSTPDYHHKKLEYLRNHGLIKCDDDSNLMIGCLLSDSVSNEKGGEYELQ